jgi:hypothetical protein
MDKRPDRPLVVKCTFDRWNKRITFNSARNCSYDLLRHKVCITFQVVACISKFVILGRTVLLPLCYFLCDSL